MDEYASDYFRQPLPLVWIQGLPSSNKTSQTQDKLNEKSKGHPLDVPTPNHSNQVLENLNELFQLESKPTFYVSKLEGVQSYSNKMAVQNNFFNFKLVDEKVNFPVKSSHTATSSTSPNSYSVLSPQCPVSKLYPDGIIDQLWFEKLYLESASCLIKFVQVFVPELNVNMELNFNFKKLVAECKDKDKVLIDTILNLKKKCGESNMKLVVVVLCPLSNPEQDELLEDRLLHIRKSCQLDKNYNFYTLYLKDVDDNFTHFSKELFTNLKLFTSQFYQDKLKKVKRKFMKHNKVSTEHNLTNEKQVSVKELSQLGWQTRYEVKLATLSQLQTQPTLKQTTNLKHLVNAYFNLSKLLITEPHYFLERTERYVQFIELLDCINFHLIRCYLYENNLALATLQFHRHLLGTTLLHQQVSTPSDKLVWWKYLQFRMMADLTDVYFKVAKSNQVKVTLNPMLTHASIFNVGTPTFYNLNLKFLSEVSPTIHVKTNSPFHDSDSSINPMAFINFPGYYYLTATTFLNQTKEPQHTEEDGSVQSSSSFVETLKLLTKVYELYRSDNLAKFTLFVATLISKQRILANQLQLAIKLLDRIGKSYAKDGWFELLRHVTLTKVSVMDTITDLHTPVEGLDLKEVVVWCCEALDLGCTNPPEIYTKLAQLLKVIQEDVSVTMPVQLLPATESNLHPTETNLLSLGFQFLHLQVKQHSKFTFQLSIHHNFAFTEQVKLHRISIVFDSGVEDLSYTSQSLGKLEQNEKCSLFVYGRGDDLLDLDKLVQARQNLILQDSILVKEHKDVQVASIRFFLGLDGLDNTLCLAYPIANKFEQKPVTGGLNPVKFVDTNWVLERNSQLRWVKLNSTSVANDFTKLRVTSPDIEVGLKLGHPNINNINKASFTLKGYLDELIPIQLQFSELDQVDRGNFSLVANFHNSPNDSVALSCPSLTEANPSALDIPLTELLFKDSDQVTVYVRCSKLVGLRTLNFQLNDILRNLSLSLSLELDVHLPFTIQTNLQLLQPDLPVQREMENDLLAALHTKMVGYLMSQVTPMIDLIRLQDVKVVTVDDSNLSFTNPPFKEMSLQVDNLYHFSHQFVVEFEDNFANDRSRPIPLGTIQLEWRRNKAKDAEVLPPLSTYTFSIPPLQLVPEQITVVCSAPDLATLHTPIPVTYTLINRTLDLLSLECTLLPHTSNPPLTFAGYKKKLVRLLPLAQVEWKVNLVGLLTGTWRLLELKVNNVQGTKEETKVGRIGKESVLVVPKV